MVMGQRAWNQFGVDMLVNGLETLTVLMKTLIFNVKVEFIDERVK